MEKGTYEEVLKYLKKGIVLGDVLKETYRQWAEQFNEHNNHLYIGERRVLPRYEVTNAISIYHDDPTMAHQSKDAIYQLMKKRYTWEGMYRDIKEYTQTCWECQQRGTARQNNMKRTIPPTDMFERWGIDIVGPLPQTEDGNRYIVVAMDYFTRWPEARPLRYANVQTVAKFIYEEIICRYGAPKVIQSDQGTHFVNETIGLLTQKFQIRYSLSSPYHPQSNGLVERFNKTLCEGIAKVAESIKDWDDYIQPVLFAYRIKELRISKHSPYYLIYGKEPVLPMDMVSVDRRFSITDRLLEIIDKVLQLRTNAKRAIRKVQHQLDEKFHKDETTFKKGDLVWYYDKAKALHHDTKLEPKWKGPYQVVAALDKGAYKLMCDGVEMKTTVNGNLLKRYHRRSSWEPLVVV